MKEHMDVADDVDEIKVEVIENKQEKLKQEELKVAVQETAEKIAPSKTLKADAKAKKSKAAETVEKLKEELAADTNTEADKSASDVEATLEKLDPEPDAAKISDADAEELRALRVEATKLKIFPRFRAIIREEHGAGGTFEDISVDAAALILPRVRALLDEAREGVAAE